MSTLCRKGRPRDKGLPFFFHLQSIGMVLILILLCFFAAHAHAQSVNITWNPNTEGDLAGYKVYYGTSSRSYSSTVDVGNWPGCTLSGLEAGRTYYIAATAYDCEGQESGYSNEVSYTAPSAAQELVIGCTPGSTEALGSKSSKKRQTQSFTAVGSRIDSVSVALIRHRSPNQVITITIRSSLSDAALASAQIQPSQVTSSDYRNPNWISVAFPTPAQVVRGSSYYLTLDVASYSYWHYYKVVLGGDVYCGGLFYRDGTTARGSYDMLSKVKFLY